MLEQEFDMEARFQETTAQHGIYVPRIRGREASGVVGYLTGLKACWERLEAMQESETEKAICRMQQRKLGVRIGLWREASDLDRDLVLMEAK